MLGIFDKLLTILRDKEGEIKKIHLEQEQLTSSSTHTVA